MDLSLDAADVWGYVGYVGGDEASLVGKPRDVDPSLILSDGVPSEGSTIVSVESVEGVVSESESESESESTVVWNRSRGGIVLGDGGTEPQLAEGKEDCGQCAA